MATENTPNENQDDPTLAAENAAKGDLNGTQQTAADNDAAFEAGFVSVRGGEEAEPVDREGSGSGGEGGAHADPVLDPVFITKAEHEAMLKEALEAQGTAFREDIRKINGKYGELNGRLAEAAKPRQLTKENFKRVAEEFPEFAESLSQDLSEIITGGHIDIDAISEAASKKTQAEIQTIRDEMNEKFLNVVAPGWDAKITSKEFSTWLTTLPPSERQGIEESTDAFEVAENLKRYDAWATEQQAAGKAAVEKAARLAAAVPATRGGGTPAGNGAGTTDANDAFEAGFRSVRGGR